MNNILADCKNASTMNLVNNTITSTYSSETNAVLECSAIILSMLSLLLLNYL